MDLKEKLYQRARYSVAPEIQIEETSNDLIPKVEKYDAIQLGEVDQNVEAISLNIVSHFETLIEQKSDEMGLYVIPASSVGLPKKIVQLPNFDIIAINGERYISPKQVRDTVISSYEELIIKTLLSGKDFEEELTISYDDLEDWQHNKLNPDNIVMKLSKSEWNTLISRFRNYNAQVYLIGNSIILKVERPEIFDE